MISMSPQGEEFLIQQEGEVLRAYQDSVGVWTIGVGHTASAGLPKPVKGMVISKAESREIMRRDLNKVFMPTVNQVLAGKITQQAVDAGGSFHFNTGAIKKASWVKKWLAGDKAGTRAGLMLWNKAGKKVLAGLTKRRSYEADIILTGVYPGVKGAAASLPGPVRKAVLVKGDVDPELITVQKNLTKIGIPVKPTGTFGPVTEEAIKKVQEAHPNLTVDGNLGPATKAAIQREADLATKTKTRAVAGSATTLATAGTLPWWVPVAAVVFTLLVLGLVLWHYRDEIRAKMNRGK